MPKLILVALLVLTACSKQQMYESARYYERNACQQEQGAAYDECMARTHKSYDDYEHEREKVTKP